MSLNIRFADPAPTYTKTLSGIARVGRSNPKYLEQGVSQILDKAVRVNDVRQRNRMVFDAVELLRGTWRAESNPDVFDMEGLRREMAGLRAAGNSPEPDLIDRLAKVVTEVEDTTPSTFKAFQASAEGSRAFSDLGPGLNEFDDWYRRYRPYLLLGVPDTPEAAEETLRERIKWMVDKIAPEQGGDEGLRELYLDDAWFYVREKYFGAQDKRSAAEAT